MRLREPTIFATRKELRRGWHASAVAVEGVIAEQKTRLLQARQEC